jgi:hypothetical protein
MVEFVSDLLVEPVRVERVDWLSREVRSKIPPAPAHQVWRLEIDFTCLTCASRAVALLDAEGDRHFARGWADGPAADITLDVHFFPFNWQTSDAVQINVGGIRHGVVSPALKKDPRELVRVHLAPGDEVSTGSVIPALTLVEPDVSVGLVLVAASDTKKDRTRWHVRSDRAHRLGSCSFLATGRRSGTVGLKNWPDRSAATC